MNIIVQCKTDATVKDYEMLFQWTSIIFVTDLSCFKWPQSTLVDFAPLGLVVSFPVLSKPISISLNGGSWKSFYTTEPNIKGFELPL